MGESIIITQTYDGGVSVQKGNRVNVVEEDKEKSCGCGCFGCCLELIGFILICYICGCSWARDTVVRCVSEIHAAWNSVGGSAR